MDYQTHFLFQFNFIQNPFIEQLLHAEHGTKMKTEES